MSLPVSVLFCSQFLVFNKNKIRFSDLLFGDAVRCFSGFPSERRASTTSVACTSSRILLKVFGFDRNLLQFSIIFCRVWQFLTHSNALPSLPPPRILETFRSDYEYEYEFFNVYPVRMPDCVRLSRQLVLSSKSCRRLDTNYEIFNKSRPPTTSSPQVQRLVKRLVFKRADTL